MAIVLTTFAGWFTYQYPSSVIENSIVLRSVAEGQHRNRRAEKSLSNFQTIIKEKGYIIAANAPMDGDCLFWSVGNQLELIGREKRTPKELRALLADYMNNVSEV